MIDLLLDEIQSVEYKEFYDISCAQKRMFLLNEFKKEHTNYNITNVYRLVGKLNKNKFNNALKKIFERHEILRTSFHLVNDKSIQKIHKQTDEYIEYIKTSKENVENIITKFIKPFDLETP